MEESINTFPHIPEPIFERFCTKNPSNSCQKCENNVSTGFQTTQESKANMKTWCKWGVVTKVFKKKDANNP